MRKHAKTKVKISEEMTRVAKCPFKPFSLKPENSVLLFLVLWLSHHKLLKM